LSIKNWGKGGKKKKRATDKKRLGTLFSGLISKTLRDGPEGKGEERKGWWSGKKGRRLFNWPSRGRQEGTFAYYEGRGEGRAERKGNVKVGEVLSLNWKVRSSLPRVRRRFI